MLGNPVNHGGAASDRITRVGGSWILGGTNQAIVRRGIYKILSVGIVACPQIPM